MLNVVRDRLTINSTEGRLSIDGVFECFTLEPRHTTLFGKPYCIPAGIYYYRVQHSQHFNRNVICIENVPGFSAIEVHPGNFPRDTHGCTLVGTSNGIDFVGHSESAFDALLAKILSEGTISYIGP
jgi:hypothetical protein